MSSNLSRRLDKLTRQRARTAYPMSPEQRAARVASFDYKGFAVVFDQLLRDEEVKRGPEAFAVWVAELERGMATMMPGGGA